MQDQPIKGLARKPLRFAVVGPGRVGASFAHGLINAGCRLERLSGRKPDGVYTEGLRRAAGETSATSIWRPIDQLATDDLDLLLITVSDPALETVARSLAGRRQAAVALHVAGQFDAEILSPLRTAGCAVGSIHPLRAFSGRIELADATGTWFAVDGDGTAKSLAEDLATLFGGSSVTVSGRQRSLYHLAATVAAGGVTTLVAVIEELMAAAELPPSLLEGYLSLTRGALAPIEPAGGSVTRYITGPAARGDVESLRRQRSLLASEAPHLLPLLERLQEETLRLCRPAPSQALEHGSKIPPPAKHKRE